MSAPGFPLGRAAFQQAMTRRLASIQRLCQQWHAPLSQYTLILRDPTNDDMSVVLSNEENLEEAWRVVRLLDGNAP